MRAEARCGKCGEALFPGAAARSPEKGAPYEQSRRPGAPDTGHSGPPGAFYDEALPPSFASRPRRRRRRALLGVVAIVGAGVLWAWPTSDTSGRTVPPWERDWGAADSGDSSQMPGDLSFDDLIPSSPPARADQLPPPVFQASGIVWNRTGRAAEAPLEIITGSGGGYFVKLVDAMTEHDAVAIFVIGGVPLEVEVPLGSYWMRYCSGETWRGESHRFGPGDLTSCSKATTRLDFVVQDGYINGFTVELIRQSGGNLPTETIPWDQF
jgi:hypothetical protein